MFENIYNLDGYLEALKLEEVLFRNDPTHVGDLLNPDDYFCQAWEEIMNFADEYVELDWTSSILYKFSFPGMVKYYDLCKEHSKINKINFKKNPYVISAEKYVDSVIRYSGVCNIAWNLWLPKKLIKKKRYIFLIETGCYFEQHIDLLDLLYTIRDYYDQKSKELAEELHGKPKLIKLPKVKSEMRKAA